MNNKIMLKDTLRSYILIFIIGLSAGIICRLTDLFPNNSLWSFSSIATLYGFWIFSITLIVYYSSSNKNAGFNTFLYMFGMTISFYLLQYILGFYMQRFNNESFQTKLFLVYSVLAVICGVGGYVLYFWNSNNKFSSMLYAMPIGALSAEAIGTAIYLYNNNTYLFQLLFNLTCAGSLGFLFYKKANNKVIYCITTIIVTIIVYAVIYRPFLNI